jgi:hypothetical protein
MFLFQILTILDEIVFILLQFDELMGLFLASILIVISLIFCMLITNLCSYCVLAIVVIYNDFNLIYMYNHECYTNCYWKVIISQFKIVSLIADILDIEMMRNV